MRKRLSLEKLCDRQLFAADIAPSFTPEIAVCELAVRQNTLHNEAKPADVDRNGSVSPVDALRIIDTLNRFGSMSVQQYSLQSATRTPSTNAEGEGSDQSVTPFAGLDANNDGSIDPIDVLVVIDALNAVPTAFMIEEQTEMFQTAFSEVTTESTMEGTVEGSTEGTVEFTSEEDPWKSTGIPDGAWVRFGSTSDSELPFFYSELDAVPLLESTNEEELMFTTMNSTTNSVSGPVSIFSQDGPLYRVIEAQAQQGNELSSNALSAVSYFSSNFLKLRR